jgi:4-amino-4-deoxy-L-arabinose transferase-like glycosyltransferase
VTAWSLASKARGASTALVLAGLAALLLPGLGALPITRAEIYFLDAARHMAESGDWLVPRYQGEPFFDKPVLAYWAMAAAFRLLGPEPAAARLVSVLAALGVVAATVGLGRRLFDDRTAIAAGVCLSTTVAFLSFGRIAMSDMLLSLFTTLGAALGARAWDEDPPRWTAPALGACLGLGFLVKGPIAVVVGGAALLALAIVLRRSPPVSGGSVAGGLLAFAVTGLGWFAVLYARLGPGAQEHFFLRENLSRFADSTYALGQPPWFYLTAYLSGGLPWSLFLPLALWRVGSESDPRVRVSARALFAWAALVLLPLTLSRGKIDYYLLPLYPAASLLVGRYFAVVPWRRLDRSWASVALLLAATALAAAALRPPRVPEPWLPIPAARALLLAVLVAGALALALAAWRPGPMRAAAALAGSVSAVFLVLSALFLPALMRAQPGAALLATVTRERARRPDLALAVCSDPARVRRDLLFHVRMPVLSRCNLTERAASATPYLLLAGPEEEAQLRAIPGLRRLASYRYLPAAITPAWLLRGPEPGELVLLANYADETGGTGR